MEAKHTPGPWKWVGDTLTSERAGDVCVVDQWAQGEEGPDGQEIADMRLIAASTELLEACKWALSQRDYSEVAEAVKRQGGSPRDGGVWRALENAIAKAEGRE